MASITATIASYSSSTYWVYADGADTSCPCDVDAATGAILTGARSIGVRVRVDTRTPQRPLIVGKEA